MSLLQSYVLVVIATITGYAGYVAMSYRLYRAQFDVFWYCSIDGNALQALYRSFETDMLRVAVSVVAVSVFLLIIGVVVLVTSDNR